VKYVLDSTLIIDHTNGLPTAVALLRRLFEEGHDLLTCDVVTCETLSAGMEVQRTAVTRLLDALEYVEIDPGAARWAGESRRRRGKRSHRTIADALIAGFAWSNGATLVTRNPRDFEAQGVPVLLYG
jgi:predicted nucleic acid-binding protein